MISKDNSLALKGIAILMMLFLHLFNSLHNVDICYTSILIGDTPLIYLLTRLTPPVPFYLILSGYGLYLLYQKGKTNNKKRLLKLYIHYWIVLILFVGIGCLIRPDKYPDSFFVFLINLLGWRTSYNIETWFLFPYVLLSLSSPLIFKMVDKWRSGFSFLITGLGYLIVGAIISKYAKLYLYDNMLLYLPLLYVSLLFQFILGALIVKKDTFFKGIMQSLPKRYIIVCFIVLFMAKISIETSALNPLYAFAFILLFTSSKRPRFINTFLIHMGKHSMTMWLIHSYFCYYLFHDYIYGLKYPILIFFVLLACSYISSTVVMQLARPICNRI